MSIDRWMNDSESIKDHARNVEQLGARNYHPVRFHSLQRQNTSGMNAPIATKIGSIAELSSFS